MNATQGAIERVSIDKETGKVYFRTIGNGPAQGLCGSGVVDLIAEMLKVGAINQTGCLKELKNQRVRLNKEGSCEFLVVQKEGLNNEDIVLTQKDIREIQLAKGAIRSGIEMLLRRMEISVEQIEHVYLAGAFGTYLDPASAVAIGMMPSFPLKIVSSIGNAAGAGARSALISAKVRNICEKIVTDIEYVELATQPDFQSIFLESLTFPNLIY
jgi:uncharacterized 2Fe-2S/4Fe-4S cluster protein (DUF4445 family)